MARAVAVLSALFGLGTLPNLVQWFAVVITVASMTLVIRARERVSIAVVIPR